MPPDEQSRLAVAVPASPPAGPRLLDSDEEMPAENSAPVLRVDGWMRFSPASTSLLSTLTEALMSGSVPLHAPSSNKLPMTIGRVRSISRCYGRLSS
jgi:hypothetical protein